MAWEPLPDQMDNTRDLNSVLGVLHRRLGLARPDSVATLEDHWVSLLGPELASHCNLEAIRQGTLVISVDDPAIADHLKWNATELVASANGICGGADFTQLKVTVAR